MRLHLEKNWIVCIFLAVHEVEIFVRDYTIRFQLPNKFFFISGNYCEYLAWKNLALKRKIY